LSKHPELQDGLPSRRGDPAHQDRRRHLHSDHDPGVLPVNGTYLAERLPHSRHDLVNAGHFAWADAADDYARSIAMPMIDVYATAGTFADSHQLATDLAAAVMTIEQVPDIPMFRQNTAAFIHDLPAGNLSNVDGDANYARIQVLTNAGALDRNKQLAVVEQLTRIAADAAGDPTLASRTWVLLTEAPDGGWGLDGHANTNEELVAAARAQIASLQAGQPAAQ
jgi:phenylpyruvate tautomerase PptA (4-oxalocrotonate tautomerase family)